MVAREETKGRRGEGEERASINGRSSSRLIRIIESAHDSPSIGGTQNSGRLNVVQTSSMAELTKERALVVQAQGDFLAGTIVADML